MTATYHDILHRGGYRDLVCDAIKIGDRAFGELYQGNDNRHLQVQFKCQLNVTADVTEILGLGSAVQVLSELGIDDGGTDIGSVDPLFWVQTSQYLAGTKITQTRASSLTAAGSPYPLVETFRIPFAYINQMKDSETYFREQSTTKKIRVYYTGIDLGGGILSPAKLVRGGTATISLASIKIQQVYDTMRAGDAPALKPWWKRITLQVPQASTAYKLDLNLDRGDILRGFTVMQWDANLGMVKDCINNFAFIGDNKNYLGTDKLIDWDNFARKAEWESGGDVYATPVGGLVHHNFQTRGMLTNCINPLQDANFRFLFDAKPSTRTGAAAASEIRILLHLLRRNPTMREDGKLITLDTETFKSRFTTLAQ